MPAAVKPAACGTKSDANLSNRPHIVERQIERTPSASNTSANRIAGRTVAVLRNLRAPCRRNTGGTVKY
jgi:hypothetical protein